MADWLNDPAVHPNPDGTYTLADEDGRIHSRCWRIRPHADGVGWRAACHDDGFGASRFASPADAIGAVLGDPAEVYVVGGRKWTMAATGFRWAVD